MLYFTGTVYDFSHFHAQSYVLNIYINASFINGYTDCFANEDNTFGFFVSLLLSISQINKTEKHSQQADKNIREYLCIVTRKWHRGSKGVTEWARQVQQVTSLTNYLPLTLF